MLNGTAVKEAIENGKNLDADPCDKVYSSCPLDREQMLQILGKLLPSANATTNWWTSFLKRKQFYINKWLEHTVFFCSKKIEAIATEIV